MIKDKKIDKVRATKIKMFLDVYGDDLNMKTFINY